MKIPKSKDSKQGGDGGGGGGGGPVWFGGWGSIDLGFIRSMPTFPPPCVGGAGQATDTGRVGREV